MIPNAIQTAQSRQSGFTLIQLCVSLALITLAATLAIPMFFSRSDISLDNAAELLALDIRSAQNRAAFLDRDITLHIRENGDGYWLDDSMTAESKTIPRVADRHYSLNAVFEGIMVQDVELAEGQKLSFHSRGKASTSARITLTDGQESRTVTVSSPDGKLTIEGSTRGWVDIEY